jgi:hypothetical protein
MIRRLAAAVCAFACAAMLPPASASGADELDPCSPAYRLFSVGHWPGACWRPYADSSPFNTPIPAHPAVNPRSDRIVRRLLGFGSANPLRAGIADTDSDYYHPTYYASDQDPRYTVEGGSSTEPFAIDGKTVRLPAGARAAGGSDHHLTIVYGGYEYGFWDARIDGTTIRVGSGRKIPIGGDGLSAGSTAGGFGNLAGIIRAPELAAGRIDHALFMAVDCTDGSYGVYPATIAAGKPACEDPTDAPPMGAHFQLALGDREIAALSVPTWKKTILRAMSHYGMYVGDVTGSPWAFQFESGSTYTSFGYEDEMVRFARSAGVPSYDEDGHRVYLFDVFRGVDWERHLRVLEPPGRLRLARIRIERGGLSAKRRGKRARLRLRFELSRSASVKVELQRASRGRLVHGRCVAAAAKRRRAPRCVRYRDLGTTRLSGAPGRNVNLLPSRLSRRVLRPGRYRVLASASDAEGNRSSASTTFGTRRH